nr:ribonuclease H-like domain, reverse transcriptase, RNA-dependent DNA polymerase [Tanacetum cinerariifolium]
MLAKGICVNEEQFIVGGSSDKPLEIIKVQIANAASRLAIEIKVEGMLNDGVPHLTKVGALNVDVSLEENIILCRQASHQPNIIGRVGCILAKENVNISGSSDKPLEIIKVQIANAVSRLANEIKVEGRLKDGVPHLTKVDALNVDVSLEENIILFRQASHQPNIIGRVGCILAKENVNINLYALTRYVGAKDRTNGTNDEESERRPAQLQDQLPSNEPEFKKCALEQAIYTRTGKDSIVLVGVYVDDLIITGTPKREIDKFKDQMIEIFEMSDLGLLAYYLGIEVTQSEGDISIKQSAYARKILKEAGMLKSNETIIPMDPGTRLMKTAEGTMEQRIMESPTSITESFTKEASTLIRNTTSSENALKETTSRKWFLKGLGAHREVLSEADSHESNTWACITNVMIGGWGKPSISMNRQVFALDCHDGSKIRAFEEQTNSWRIFIDSNWLQIRTTMTER